MFKVEDIKKQYPEVEEDGQTLRWLWHCGYWDGPLDGIVEFQGCRMWCQYIYEESDKESDEPGFRERIFIIQKLTTDQLVAEEERHSLFKRHVGKHTDYKFDPKRGFSVRSRGPNILSNSDNFYNHPVYGKNYSRSYDHNEIIAWFRW